MSVFYGLVLKPFSKYVQVVSKPFHISNAALDEGDFAKLYLTINEQRYAVATLSESTAQMQLDLNFCEGDQLMFQSIGNGTISLLGYLHAPQATDDEEYLYLGGDDAEDTVTDETANTWYTNAGEGYDGEETDYAEETDNDEESDDNYGGQSDNDGDNEDEESKSEDECNTNTGSEEVQRGVEDGDDDEHEEAANKHDDSHNNNDECKDTHNEHEEKPKSDVCLPPPAKRARNVKTSNDRDMNSVIIEVVKKDLCGGLPCAKIGTKRRQTWPCSGDSSASSVHEEPLNLKVVPKGH